MTTTFETPVSYQPVSSPEIALAEIYTRASDALDQHGLEFAYCNMFIEISPDRTAFAEVQIDASTSSVAYFVTSSDDAAARIPALDYTQALRQLRSVMR